MSETTAPSLARNLPAAYPHTFLPLQPQPVGSPLPDGNTKDVKLFSPLTIKSLTFPNRLFAAPMCQYSAYDGHATDWHMVHLGSMATRGIGAIIVEATAVLPEGRISPEDMGLWKDSQIEPMKRIVDFVHAHGGVIGVQLAHAGRKAGTLAPWAMDSSIKRGDVKEKGKSSVAHADAGGWPENIQAPSPISFSPTDPAPQELTLEGIEAIKQAFVDAVERCEKIGYDFIEIHGAHGYLLHNFVSPLSNHRTDAYGGPLSSRLRLPLEIAQLVREKWNKDKPLFYRLSATDWYEGEERGDDYAKREEGGDGVGGKDEAEEEGWKFWGIQQTTRLVRKLKSLGIDMIDVSSGGNYYGQKIKIGPGYQVLFAAHLKKEVPGILIGAVGLITSPQQAEDILQEGHADLILLARELLRNVDFPIEAAEALGVKVQPAVQYERAWTRMLGDTVPKKV